MVSTALVATWSMASPYKWTGGPMTGRSGLDPGRSHLLYEIFALTTSFGQLCAPPPQATLFPRLNGGLNTALSKGVRDWREYHQSPVSDDGRVFKPRRDYPNNVLACTVQSVPKMLGPQLLQALVAAHTQLCVVEAIKAVGQSRALDPKSRKDSTVGPGLRGLQAHRGLKDRESKIFHSPC
ncbi:unnamed protein product [Timema podura]|uniref:Uncharacterized protein n=1 Tax=Timema podura TaxID=61482 RepID=A0ABN7NQE8_TIMPD|nr:unnamed protein product [Timema podura]